MELSPSHHGCNVLFFSKVSDGAREAPSLLSARIREVRHHCFPTGPRCPHRLELATGFEVHRKTLQNARNWRSCEARATSSLFEHNTLAAPRVISTVVRCGECKLAFISARSFLPSLYMAWSTSVPAVLPLKEQSSAHDNTTCVHICWRLELSVCWVLEH